MSKAILGKKLGMSQVFTPEGLSIPVTVIEAGPCPVIQKKTVEKDGYSAHQIGFGDIKEKNVNKPVAGHFKKAGIKPVRKLMEFRTDSPLEVGSEIKADIFAEGELVDVSGTSKGHGFSGTIKRWNFSRGPMSHGSGYHRGVGSMGANSTPSRVLPGKKLPGQYGNEAVTVQNLKVVRVDTERNLILVKGAVPGPKNGFVVVKAAVKK